MMRRPSFNVLGVALTIVLAGSFFVSRANADQSITPLPSVGSSQAYVASQQFPMPGGMLPPGGSSAKGGGKLPHDQSGTLTLTRAASDSVRVAASDGLDNFDQSLHADANGTIAQSSPANPFVDVFDMVAVMLAAAPANLQKNATWNIKVAAPSWMNSMGMTVPKDLSSVPMTITAVSVAANAITLHGEGKATKTMPTGMGPETIAVSLSTDCTIGSGRLKSCSRTTGISTGIASGSYGFDETTTLTAK
jgi:hypothetical protein